MRTARTQNSGLPADAGRDLRPASICAAALTALLVLALAASPASALSTIPAGDTQDVWVQQGATTMVPLLLSASSSDTGKRISADGDNKAWVSFNGKDFFDLNNEGQIPLPVTFTVPADAKIDVVTIKLLLGSDTFYTFKVNVVLKPEDIRGLQAKAQTGEQIADLNTQLTTQVDALTQQLTAVQANVQTSLDKALQAQSQVTTLSSEKATLQAQLTAATQQLGELRAERDRLSTQNQQLQVTGNLIGGASPVTFGAGLLIGAGALYLLFGRRWGWVHKRKAEQPARPL